MPRFGLLGRSLSHSFSKSYFEEKFKALQLLDHTYENIELTDITDFSKAEALKFAGLNVTVPYKEVILPFVDEMQGEAKEIGAVNCIQIRDGKLIGWNTDAYGFGQSIKPFLDNNHERALILGTGGASKAVGWSLKKLGLEVLFATSKTPHGNAINYADINDYVMKAFKLVVNTTPLGMYPDTGSYPQLPYHGFTPEHLAYDLIYNPPQTEFMKRAAAAGAVTMNGLSMLKLQAERSWEIWNGKG